MSQEKLFAEFPPVSTEDWEKVIVADLKGADYDKKLVWKTWEGIPVKPYYRAEDLKNLQWLLDNLPGEFPFVRGAKKTDNDWEVRAEIYEADVATANASARRNLERGCDAVSFRSRICGGNKKIYGQNVQVQSDFDALLQGIDLAATKVYFDWGVRGAQALAMLINHVGGKSIAGGALMYDPLAELAKAGKIALDKDKIAHEAAEVAKAAAEKLPTVKAITVQTHHYHNAGANIVQEMAIALAAGTEYMNALTDNGLSAAQAASQIGFSFSTGSNYFFEIAKLRAFRALWANVLKAYGVTGTASIHCRTSLWNATVFDPNVNMLRASTEAMSAALGGCDALTVVPYDASFKTPDEFSYRIARNTQLLLKYESGFNKIVDPSAGSYYIESITDQLATKALEGFKKIEAEGGLLAALLAGTVQKEIAAVQAQKDKAITQRREVFLGTNAFPNLNEKMSANMVKAEGFDLTGKVEYSACGDVQKFIDKFSTGKKCCCSCGKGGEGESCDCGETTVTKLDVRRGAEVFEKLRLATEAYAQKTGSAPKVFLWTAGDLGMRLARATFVKNFFGCAGYTAIDTNGVPDAAAGIELMKKHNPEIVVLCSKDDEYVALAQEIFPAITAAFPKAIKIIAGNPKEQMEELKAAGAQDFIHVMTNAIDSLTAYQAKLGVN